MPPLTITAACGRYDRTQPVLDGRVNVEGCTVAPVVLPPSQLFPRAFQRGEFDVSELSGSSYILQTSRGDPKYVAVPIFPSRAFRHHCIYVSRPELVDNPEALKGATIGFGEYQQTLGVWMRGILSDEYGIDPRSIKCRTGGINDPGRKERLKLTLPPEFDVTPIPADRTLNDMLVAGELDAAITPYPPTAYLDAGSPVTRLFSDATAREKDFYQRRGIFPTMHVIGIRRELVEQHAWLPRAVFDAFSEANAIALDEMRSMANLPVLKLALPWLGACLDETRSLMGDDYWSVGVEDNRQEIETLVRYMHEQGLIEKPLPVEALFHPDTLDA